MAEKKEGIKGMLIFWNILFLGYLFSSIQMVFIFFQEFRSFLFMLPFMISAILFILAFYLELDKRKSFIIISKIAMFSIPAAYLVLGYWPLVTSFGFAALSYFFYASFSVRVSTTFTH